MLLRAARGGLQRRVAWGARGLALDRCLADDDSFVFPNEQAGNQYKLNWTLCGNGPSRRDSIVPNNEAFRVTNNREAEQLAGGVAAAPTGKEEPAPEVDWETFNAEFAKVKERLEAAPKLYVAEGHALSVMAHALEQMPKRKAMELPITCYVTRFSGAASSAALAPVDAASRPSGADFAGLGLDDDDGRIKIVLSGGHATSGEIKSSVKTVAVALKTTLDEKEAEAAAHAKSATPVATAAPA
ncbi:hypothetical protein M885DRAFT_584541 [Pelagophyceae sp. CCMP2097]|nr:hypothetical protein M885DRAFT_584541 [Pelagophyceae sp. CCMP2097]